MNPLIESWYRPKWWTALLLPLAFIYRMIIAIRKLCYRLGIFKTTKFSSPVIVVGNISVGGTGKTPLVIWLVDFLKREGYKPGVVSRGYIPKQFKKNQAPILVNSDADPAQIGDEALLIATRTQVPVAVCPDRVKAVEFLLNNYGCDIIISDDGLQHYAMGRDIEIAVLDGKRRLGNGFLLPAGPLREPAKCLKSVNFVVVNTGQPRRGEYQMTLIPGDAYNIQHPEQQKPLKAFIGQTLHAVAGIGNPQRFFLGLRDHNLLIVEHAYPDHHQYKRTDINFYGSLNVIMTEKDAVKCKQMVDSRHWCLPVTAKLDEFFIDKLQARLRLCSTKK